MAQGLVLSRPGPDRRARDAPRLASATALAKALFHLRRGDLASSPRRSGNTSGPSWPALPDARPRRPPAVAGDGRPPQAPTVAAGSGPGRPLRVGLRDRASRCRALADAGVDAGLPAPPRPAAPGLPPPGPRAGELLDWARLLADSLVLRGHDAFLVTVGDATPPPSLLSTPLAYRDRAHLLAAFPEVDVVVSGHWTVTHRWMFRLMQRHAFTPVQYVGATPAWSTTPSRTPRRRRRIQQAYQTVPYRIVNDVTFARPSSASATLATTSRTASTSTSSTRASAPIGLMPRRSWPWSRRPGSTALPWRPACVGSGRPSRPCAWPSTAPDQGTAGRVAARRRAPRPLEDPRVRAGTLSDFDVFLDPAAFRHFGKPGLEAMVCGVPPVLTTGCGASEYAQDGRNAFLYRRARTTSWPRPS